MLILRFWSVRILLPILEPEFELELRNECGVCFLLTICSLLLFWVVVC